jgi:predicted SnoaL-like aldol condensation-catalyzing enzyme
MEHPNTTASRRWFDEVWNRKTPGAIAAIMPAHCVAHTENGSVVGPEAFAAIHAQFVALMPDIQFTIEAGIHEGGLVALRWHAVATGPGSEQITIRGCTWHRYEDGVIVDGWDFYNLGGLMQCLGATSGAVA